MRNFWWLELRIIAQALFTSKLNNFWNFFNASKNYLQIEKSDSKCVDLLQFGCKSNYFGERKKLIFLFYKTKIVGKLRPIKRCCEFLRFFFSNRIANKRLKEKRNKKGFFSLKLERLKFFSELCSIFKYLRLKNFKVSVKVIWWH